MVDREVAYNTIRRLRIRESRDCYVVVADNLTDIVTAYNILYDTNLKPVDADFITGPFEYDGRGYSFSYKHKVLVWA